MGEVTGKAWLDHSEPRIMAADLEAIEAAIVEAAASTIIGVGRPDIPATLTTPGTAALAAAATSGTVFRSTDGPQGAWEWMKRGSTWAVTDGDTGWIDIGANLDPEIWLPAASQPRHHIRRTAREVELVLRIRPADARLGAPRTIPQLLLAAPGLPSSFAMSEFVGAGAASSGGLTGAISGEMSRPRLSASLSDGTWAASDTLTASVRWQPSSAAWPTTLTL